MSTEVLTVVLSAGVQATLGQGRILYVKSATAPLSIVLEQSQGYGRARRTFTNIPAGFKLRAAEADAWTYTRITSATSQTVEIILGDDDVEFASAVSVTGTASVAEAPSSSVTATAADVSVANAGNSAIAANTGRRRITIQALDTNTGNLRVGTSTTTGQGIVLQPGQAWEFKTTAALYVTNNSGAAQSYTVFEES